MSRRRFKIGSSRAARHPSRDETRLHDRRSIATLANIAVAGPTIASFSRGTTSFANFCQSVKMSCPARAILAIMRGRRRGCYPIGGMSFMGRSGLDWEPKSEPEQEIVETPAFSPADGSSGSGTQ